MLTLVTSRQRLTQGQAGAVLELKSLKGQPAEVLLISSAGDEVVWKTGQAEKLAEVLGFNAYALEMVGGFLKATAFTIEVTIFTLRLRRADLVSYMPKCLSTLMRLQFLGSRQSNSSSKFVKTLLVFKFL